MAVLRDAALVHDVGTIGVPDAILRKTGPLDVDERRMIRAHAALGARILKGLMAPDQLAWVRHHHERYDGGGYPDGLAGAGIPEGARILAVADVLDVMTGDRCHRRAGRWEQAVAECARVAGTRRCPDAVAAARRPRARGALPPRQVPGSR